MQQKTDDQLMTAVKNGSDEALSALFQRYQKQIFNFFYKMTGNRSLSEDLLQDVFYKIMKARSSYREHSNFRAWIYTIGRNLYRDHLRKNTMHVNLEEIEQTLSDHQQAEKQAIWSEEQQLLHKSLRRLPDKMQQVLILSRFQQLKYEEIGEIMDLSVGAVKVTVFRALKELRATYFQLAGELA